MGSEDQYPRGRGATQQAACTPLGESDAQFFDARLQWLRAAELLAFAPPSGQIANQGTIRVLDTFVR